MLSDHDRAPLSGSLCLTVTGEAEPYHVEPVPSVVSPVMMSLDCRPSAHRRQRSTADRAWGFRQISPFERFSHRVPSLRFLEKHRVLPHPALVSAVPPADPFSVGIPPSCGPLVAVARVFGILLATVLVATPFAGAHPAICGAFTAVKPVERLDAAASTARFGGSLVGVGHLFASFSGGLGVGGPGHAPWIRPPTLSRSAALLDALEAGALRDQSDG